MAWEHEHDARFDFTEKQTQTGLALAANELNFLSHDPSPEQCSEFLESGRTITDAGRWAIVRFSTAKRDHLQARQRVAELERERAAGLKMLGALRGLIFPAVPSADDLMLLFLATGVTAEQQEKFRPYVESVRAAQAAGRAALAEAEGK